MLLVSYVGVSDALVPNLGSPDRTVSSLEFDVTVPTTKPVTNVARLLHCRSNKLESRSAGGTVFQHHRLETVRAVARQPRAYFPWS